MAFDKFENDLQGAEDDLRTWWMKFKLNVAYYWHYATAWSAAIWASIYAYWGLLSDDTKASYVGSFISPSKVPVFLGLFAVISHFITQGWPQPKLVAKVEVKKVESMAQAAAMDASTPMPVTAARVASSDPGPDTIPAQNKPL